MRHLPSGMVVIAAAPPRRVSGRSKRASYQGPRRRKLTADQEAGIRAAAGNRSLRSLAADVGVSHETVRAVLRGRVGMTVTKSGFAKRAEAQRRDADDLQGDLLVAVPA